MTVEELVDILSRQPPEAECFVFDEYATDTIRTVKVGQVMTLNWNGSPICIFARDDRVDYEPYGLKVQRP